jgi:hypothetical protein
MRSRHIETRPNGSSCLLRLLTIRKERLSAYFCEEEEILDYGDLLGRCLHCHVRLDLQS